MLKEVLRSLLDKVRSSAVTGKRPDTAESLNYPLTVSTHGNYAVQRGEEMAGGLKQDEELTPQMCKDIEEALVRGKNLKPDRYKLI